MQTQTTGERIRSLEVKTARKALDLEIEFRAMVHEPDDDLQRLKKDENALLEWAHGGD